MSIENPKFEKKPAQDKDLSSEDLVEEKEEEPKKEEVPESEEEKVEFSDEKIADLSLEKKILNPEEVEQLGGEMNEYVAGLKLRIDEIKAELEGKIGKKKKEKLEAELEELQTEYDGLSEIADGIETGEYEEITEAPFKETGSEDEEEKGEDEEKEPD